MMACKPKESKSKDKKRTKASHFLQNSAIDELKATTGVLDEQLDREFEDEELVDVADYFGNPQQFLPILNLSEGDHADINLAVLRDGNRLAMYKAIRLWCKKNPAKGTFRELINIAIATQRRDVAKRICRFVTEVNLNL